MKFMTPPEKLNFVTHNEWAKNFAKRNKNSSIKIKLQKLNRNDAFEN